MTAETRTMGPRRPLQLPPDLGRRFVVFVDTEEEFDWSAPFSRCAMQTSAIQALPQATTRFNQLGIEPVWLCDYPVVTNPQSAAIIQSLMNRGGCWIGAHLHPWVTPPFDEPVTSSNSFANNLSRDLEQAKMARLTEAIQAATGQHPLIYRAGRYGIRAESFSALASLGYALDVSVRPHFDYHQEGGPDFRDFLMTPWRTEPGVTCLPMTTGFAGRWRAFPALSHMPILGRMAAAAQLLMRCPLTPEGTPLSIAREVIAVLDAQELSLFSLSFHSPSLVPGHTPYVRSQADLKIFWQWWDGVTNEFAKRGIKSIGAKDLLTAFAAAKTTR
jgi:hypothetical protein